MPIKQYMIPVPKMETPPHVPDNVVFWPETPERYVNDEKNRHHWTSKYVWDKVVPAVAKDYDIPFVRDDYAVHEYKTKLGDFSHHKFKTKHSITFTDIENGKTLHGTSDILRVKPNEPMWSDYHRLFRGAHRISTIINHDVHSGRVLLINGDSMTVPLIPILANYFDKIIALDNRSKFNKKIPNLINKMEITDYMAMFTTLGWINKGLPYLYMGPYVEEWL